jgi:predicted dehydrogenase
MDDFARALDTGSEPILNAQNGRDIAATIFAAVESGKTGQPVEVTY